MQREEAFSNYPIYIEIEALFDNNANFSGRFYDLIEELRLDGNPIIDPIILKLGRNSLNLAAEIAPQLEEKILGANHLLERSFEDFDGGLYDLLATYLFDVSDHLKVEASKNPLNERKSLNNLATLIESLAAISVNNACASKWL